MILEVLKILLLPGTILAITIYVVKRDNRIRRNLG